MNASLLADLTIVIPSFRRQSFLQRQLQYWSEFPVNIIVLDGTPTAAAHLAQTEKFQYFHLPVSIEERFSFAIDKIDTKYAALLSDDDLFLPIGLQKCVKFLDENPDYVSCKGTALGFTWKDGHVEYKSVYPGLLAYNIDALSAPERIYQHLSTYQMATLWAVMRKNVFISTLSAMSAGPKFRSAAVGEIQTSIVAAFCGKCAVISSLMWLRSFENPNIWWNDGRQTIAEWFKDPSNVLEHARFSHSVVSALNLSTVSCGDWPLSALREFVVGQVDRRDLGFLDQLRSYVRSLFLSSSIGCTAWNTFKQARTSISSLLGVSAESSLEWKRLEPQEIVDMLLQDSIHVEMSDLLYASNVIGSFYLSKSS